MTMQDDLFDASELASKPDPTRLGKPRKNGGYTLTTPREWNAYETDYLTRRLGEGASAATIAVELGRSATSVAIKAKRLGKHNAHAYNRGHALEKYIANGAFAEILPDARTVLDLYCGVDSYWRSRGFDAVTNDKDTRIEADYHERADVLACRLFAEGRRFDIVDLDPFGSAFEALVPALRIARMGLIVTLGEMGHRRWKRLDFVRRVYGIKRMEDFTSLRIAQEIERIGAAYKVSLSLVALEDYPNISRAYFLVANLPAIVEQWEGKE